MSGGKIYQGQELDGRFANRIEGNLLDSFTVTAEKMPIDRLLAPIVPTDILCIGLNYKEHANEGGFHAPPVPMLFIKASNTLNDPGAPIAVPAITHEVDFEAELAIVIGKSGEAREKRKRDELRLRLHHGQ